MFNLVSNEPKSKQPWFVKLRKMLLLLTVILFVGNVGLLLSDLPASTLPATRALSTVLPMLTSTPVQVLRTAWIEARDTCQNSSEYRDLVVPGATLWKNTNQDTPSKTNVRHGTLVNILSENAKWTRIDYYGQIGYVQSFFIVDYDPSKEFKPATGKRFCALCSLDTCDLPTPAASIEVMPTVAPPIAPTSTQVPTEAPTPTPVSLSELNLESLLVQPGDLPIGIEAAQILDTAPAMFDGIVKADQVLIQHFSDGKEQKGGIAVFLYESPSDIESAYTFIKATMDDEPMAPANVGEKSVIYFLERQTIKLQGTTYQISSDSIDFLFQRCHVVVHFRMVKDGLTPTKAASYAERLDKRLSPVVCR